MKSPIKPFFTSLLIALSLTTNADVFTQKFKNFNNTYEVKIVRGVSLDKRALLGGAVVSLSQVSLSAQVAGDVIKVNGKEGDVFKKGDILVVLEQESIQAQRDSAYTEIASANEALRNANVQYSQSVVSPYSNSPFGSMGGVFSSFTDPMMRFTGQGNPDFDKFANRTSRYTNYQQAKNKLIQAQLKLKQIEERLKDASIVAPFDGVITFKYINQGDIVQQTQPLLKFADVANLQVEVDMPSRLVNSLKLGKKYRIKLDVINIVVNATLSQIYPIADNNKHSVKVKFDLPKNVPVLSGVYAEVEVFEANSNALTPVIPEKSIIWRSSLPSVFVINPRTNLTELRFIRLGEQVGNAEQSVLSGLKIGEKIVTNPNILMISGMKI